MDEGVPYRTLLGQGVGIDPELCVFNILHKNDQQLSLYLQQRVKVEGPNDCDLICSVVGRFVVELSLSKFGNFLVSRCLEVGGADNVANYSESIRGRALEMALDQYGCHPLQKFIDVAGLAVKETIIEELIDHVSTLTQKSSGHVWSKLLATPNPPEFYRRLSETGKRHWDRIARDETGSLIVQSILEKWPEADKSCIGEEALGSLSSLAKSQWGSFVVLHLVEHCAERFRSAILKDAVQLTLDQFGVKAVDKAFRRERNLSPFALHSYVEGICSQRDPETHRPVITTAALLSNGVALLSNIYDHPHITTGDRNLIALVLLRSTAELEQSQCGQRVLAMIDSQRS
ncbi:ARM repeat-containing protein [Meredithblackwellia eburnea MCA 4105]